MVLFFVLLPFLLLVITLAFRPLFVLFYTAALTLKLTVHILHFCTGLLLIRSSVIGYITLLKYLLFLLFSYFVFLL